MIAQSDIIIYESSNALWYLANRRDVPQNVNSPLYSDFRDWALKIQCPKVRVLLVFKDGTSSRMWLEVVGERQYDGTLIAETIESAPAEHRDILPIGTLIQISETNILEVKK